MFFQANVCKVDLWQGSAGGPLITLWVLLLWLGASWWPDATGLLGLARCSLATQGRGFYPKNGRRTF